MRVFPYEVGDPTNRSGHGIIIERVNEHGCAVINYVAVYRNGKIVWRGSLADLAETLEGKSESVHVVYRWDGHSDDRTAHLPPIDLSDMPEGPRDLGGFNCAGEYRWPDNQHCPKHPDQPLARTSVEPGSFIWPCPICTADVLDEMAKQPGTITINVGSKKDE